jgi:hypothetical protein
MSQNLVIANKDNLVVYVFAGVDLTTATDIKVKFGSESYTLLLNPSVVIVTSATELSLNLSATLEVGKVFSTVTYFNAASTLGTDITSRELANADEIIVAIGTQLIIEDGTGVANANSLTTDAEFKAFAKLKGYSIPATEPDRDALQANAYDFMNFTYESRLQGYRVKPQVQTGILPRNYMYAYDVLVASTSIPQDFKNAQMLASFSINAGVDTNAVKTDANLASFTVPGVYSETYQSGSSTPTLAQMPAVSKVLRPYTKAAVNGGGLHRDNMGYIG